MKESSFWGIWNYQVRYSPLIKSNGKPVDYYYNDILTKVCIHPFDSIVSVLYVETYAELLYTTASIQICSRCCSVFSQLTVEQQ